MNDTREFLLLAIDLLNKAYMEAVSHASETDPELKQKAFHTSQGYREAAALTIAKENKLHHENSTTHKETEPPPINTILTKNPATGLPQVQQKTWLYLSNGWNCIENGSAHNPCCPHDWQDIYYPDSLGTYALTYTKQEKTGRFIPHTETLETQAATRKEMYEFLLLNNDRVTPELRDYMINYLNGDTPQPEPTP